MKELYWDYYNGYYYKDVKRKILTKKKKKIKKGVIMQNKFKEARELMNETLLKDKGLYQGYQSNIAMLLHDEQIKCNDKPINYKNYNNRNEMAKSIINLIFS